MHMNDIYCKQYFGDLSYCVKTTKQDVTTNFDRKTDTIRVPFKNLKTVSNNRKRNLPQCLNCPENCINLIQLYEEDEYICKHTCLLLSQAHSLATRAGNIIQTTKQHLFDIKLQTITFNPCKLTFNGPRHKPDNRFINTVQTVKTNKNFVLKTLFTLKTNSIIFT